MAVQQRKEQPKKFLDASLVSLEKALLARADSLEKESDSVSFEIENASYEGTAWFVARRVANEYRLLAEEMHYW